jgi:hypothetical protein
MRGINSIPPPNLEGVGLYLENLKNWNESILSHLNSMPILAKCKRG